MIELVINLLSYINNNNVYILCKNMYTYYLHYFDM